MLEQKVLDIAMELFTTKVNLDIICDEIMRIHEKSRSEQSVLKLLYGDKAKAEKSLANILVAIEEGIINSTTKNRMTKLEQQIEEVNAKILIEESKLENILTREEVMEYLTASVRDLSPQVLIEILVNRIDLCYDEIVVWFNYSDRTSPDDPNKDSRFLFYKKTIKYRCQSFCHRFDRNYVEAIKTPLNVQFLRLTALLIASKNPAKPLWVRLGFDWWR